MKTLPIINLSRYDNQSSLLREYIRRSHKKTKRVIYLTPPEQKQEPIELISEKEKKKF